MNKLTYLTVLVLLLTGSTLFAQESQESISQAEPFRKNAEVQPVEEASPFLSAKQVEELRKQSPGQFTEWKRAARVEEELQDGVREEVISQGNGNTEASKGEERVSTARSAGDYEGEARDKFLQETQSPQSAQAPKPAKAAHPQQIGADQMLRENPDTQNAKVSSTADQLVRENVKTQAKTSGRPDDFVRSSKK